MSEPTEDQIKLVEAMISEEYGFGRLGANQALEAQAVERGLL